MVSTLLKDRAVLLKNGIYLTNIYEDYELKISRFRKEFRNLTICWNTLRAYFTYIVKINKIGKSAGNLFGFLRDYTLGT